MSTTVDLAIPPRFRMEAGEDYVTYLVEPPSLGSMGVSLLGAAFMFGSGLLFMVLAFQVPQGMYQVTILPAIMFTAWGSWQFRALFDHSHTGQMSFTLTNSLLIVRLNGWQGGRSLTWHRGEISLISSAFVFDVMPSTAHGPLLAFLTLKKNFLWVKTTSGERTAVGQGYYLRQDEVRWLTGVLRRALDLHEPPKRLQLP